MKNEKEYKSMCFAYFGDNKFIGWYSDTFGTVTKNNPKVYQYSESQVEIVKKNFQYNVSKFREKSELAVKTGDSRLSLLDNGINSTRKGLSDYETLELRVIECPHYEGENPNFDEEAWNLKLAERKQKMTEEGIFEIPAPSIERSKAVKDFDTRNPYPKCDNWIYCDYKKVMEWALNEPTEFLQLLNSK